MYVKTFLGKSESLKTDERGPQQQAPDPVNRATEFLLLLADSEARRKNTSEE